MTLPTPLYATTPEASHFALGELTVVVFGPGRGEASIVIFPDGHLGVVDGCREPTRGAVNGAGDPVREFIRAWHTAHPRLDGRIRFVALTHPHEDHYAGLARLMSAYLGKIDHLWSPFPTGDQYVSCFRDYYELERSNPDGVPDAELLEGLTRYYVAFERCRTHEPAPEYTCMYADRTLFERRMQRYAFSVRSVAPDDGDIMYAHNDLRDALQRATDSAVRKIRVRHNPNLTSGALVIRWGTSQILLGGDLLCASSRFKGWSQAEKFINGPVQVVKAAHHGSAGAQEWGLLGRIQPALVLLTPFQEAKNGQPPKPDELGALLRLCPDVALTSPPHWWTERGTRPRPRRHRAQRNSSRQAARNSVLPFMPDPPPTADGIGVSLDAAGNITRVVLAGRADFYEP